MSQIVQDDGGYPVHVASCCLLYSVQTAPVLVKVQPDCEGHTLLHGILTGPHKADHLVDHCSIHTPRLTRRLSQRQRRQSCAAAAASKHAWVFQLYDLLCEGGEEVGAVSCCNCTMFLSN